MEGFVFQVDKDIVRFEIEYAKVDVYLLKEDRVGNKQFNYQSTSTPESVLKYLKGAEVMPILDYGYRGVGDCVKALNEAREYI